jgi:hypothetical protein
MSPHGNEWNPVCETDMPVSRLAEQVAIHLASWEDDPLGSATGFLCRLPSGLVLLLEKFPHAPEQLAARGPAV